MSTNDELARRTLEAFLEEKRKDRRWRNARLLLILLMPLLLLAVAALLSRPVATAEPYVALVRITGEIGPGKEASAEKLNPSLVQAFEDEQARGIVLLINSPGGTPVQASLIHDRVRALKRIHPNKKVIAVGEDMVTSGAYFVAVSSDKIYVNRSSIVGSIGVIARTFGLDKLMDRVGVESRTLTAGTAKNRLDPFAPVREEDREKMQDVLRQMHQHFIETVKESRKQKLSGKEDLLFSGDFWVGEEAKRLGLVDGLSDLPTILQEEFHVSKYRDYSPRKPFWENLAVGMAAGFVGRLVAENELQALPALMLR